MLIISLTKERIYIYIYIYIISYLLKIRYNFFIYYNENIINFVK
ncbi:MAG: hypothetical protein N7Q72_06730 [Spiroplasma sp. Tabriz.8]|nr:hypothetical protein [Spiroplasma sp. Tabriz.8]